jgi:precorrin-2/cobalt-factor-2 C20-methyltransferase
MSLGTFYGIGVGPGDPDLVTLKGVKALARCRHVFVPQARDKAESLALEIARPHLRPDACVHTHVYPMTRDQGVLQQHWRQAAQELLQQLSAGDDCCFLTLGDCLLYSTYIYLLRELRILCPTLKTVTVPGITSFSAVAALTQVPLGEGQEVLTIVPACDDWEPLRRALDQGGPVVLMKVGRRLEKVLDELESRGRLERAVFVAHATLPDQRVELDLRRLRGQAGDIGYLSTIVVQAADPAARPEVGAPKEVVR